MFVNSSYAAQAFNHYAKNNQSQAQPPPGASGQQTGESGQTSGGAMPPDNKKGGSQSRDARKINQKRLDAAKQNVASLRAQRDFLRAQPNKTPEENLKLKRLDRALNRELDRQRKSETHGRKGKGS
jgi:hypothetical protein